MPPRPPPRFGSWLSSFAAAASALLPVGMAVSMKTMFSQTIGEAEPSPGSFTFHLMLLVSLQVVGGLASGATPVASGPRHCGQFSFAVAADTVPIEPSQSAAARPETAPKIVIFFIKFL